MNIRRELHDIKSNFLKWFFTFIIVSVLLFSVGFSYTTINGISFPFPSLASTSHSLSALFFIQAKHDLLPPSVILITTSPISVFLVQFEIAFLGGFLLTLPYLLYSVFRYLSPALFPREKKMLLYSITILTILFFGGAFFAYRFLILSMFTMLLSFNLSLDVAQYLSIDEFMSWTLSTLLLTGSMFLFPILMYVLSFLRITRSSFWVRYWREAAVIFLIIASIVTPDVSGISIILLSLPMTLLYIFGIVLSRFQERRRGDIK